MPVANQFDVVILGGGPAGYVGAIRASQLCMTVAVVEREKLGGVCVNIGCIPTKALLHSAYIANLLKESKDFGVEVGSVKTDYGVAMKRSRRVSEQNSKGVEFLMKKNKVTVVKGTGVLQPGKKVKVGGDVYEAKKVVIIATGSRVKGIPQIGLEINKTTVISSDEALLMEKIPASLAIVGAGAVGMEFADIFNAFGVKITLIEALPRILPLEDAEASDALAKSYKKRGIEVIAGAKVTKATVAKDKVTLALVTLAPAITSMKKSVAANAVLMAAGRAVNTENVGLAECGIQVTERGFKGGQEPPDDDARLLRDRRRRGAADAGAQGPTRGRLRRRAARRPNAARHQVRQRSERHVLPPRGREHRSFRRSMQRTEARLRRRALPVLGEWARPRDGRDRGIREDPARQEVRRDPGRAHRRRTRLRD